MSKMNKAQTAGTVCKEGAAATVGGAVGAINEAAKKLEGLAKTEDFSPLTGIVDEIASLAGRKFDESEDSKLMVCFSEAVARLHNVVFDREGAVLFRLRNEYEKWVPLTQQCLKASDSRAKVLLPRNFCECTRLLSYAFNFEWEKRWQLMELYDELQSDMWGLAKKLAGEGSGE